MEMIKIYGKSICAVATASAEGALSVIRISGEDAIEIAARVFTPYGKTVAKMEGYTCAYGIVTDGGERIDDAVLTVFRAPNSYTGENTAEISCHGGKYVTNRIFRLCCDNGARPAERGEFTKTALLNGKLSLTQAEAVAEMISAQGELTLRAANLTRQGKLFEKIDGVKRRITVLLGKLAAWIDYPDEEIPEVTETGLCEELKILIAELRKLERGYDNGMLLKNGIPAAIIGKPNVGKSTLMNLLLGYDRAIVTSKAGTTRDLLEESVRIGDVTLRLADTAGLRETDDEVEMIGVELAKKRLSESALLIGVFDGSVPPTDEDRQIAEKIAGYTKRGRAKAIALINKSDIAEEDKVAEYRQIAEKTDIESMTLSAKRGDGQREFENIISKMYINQTDDGIIFVNERQKNCLTRAIDSLKKALEGLEAGVTFDAVGVDISEGAESLSELTGERITDAVVEEVFANFCVGK